MLESTVNMINDIRIIRILKPNKAGLILRAVFPGGSFGKDVTYDNIKSHKNQGFTFSLEDTFLDKPLGGQNDPPAFVGLNCITLIALQPQPW